MITIDESIDVPEALSLGENVPDQLKATGDVPWHRLQYTTDLREVIKTKDTVPHLARCIPCSIRMNTPNNFMQIDDMILTGGVVMMRLGVASFRRKSDGQLFLAGVGRCGCCHHVFYTAAQKIDPKDLPSQWTGEGLNSPGIFGQGPQWLDQNDIPGLEDLHDGADLGV